MSKPIKGELEIDRKRGVIYFHVSDPKDAEKIGGVTLLRLQGFPKPIPKGQMLDMQIIDCVYNWHPSFPRFRKRRVKK